MARLGAAWRSAAWPGNAKRGKARQTKARSFMTSNVVGHVRSARVGRSLFIEIASLKDVAGLLYPKGESNV